MFRTKTAKIVSTVIRSNPRSVQSAIADTIKTAVLGADEVPFIKRFEAEWPNRIETAIQGLGLQCKCDAISVHQKPQVWFNDSSASRVRCELGDILLVVKYVVGPGQFEAKSVIYQAKMTDTKHPTKCKINQRQLELLRDWPAFELGRNSQGQAVPYVLNPTTTEFGSYMLMRRRPNIGEYVSLYRQDYGVAPNALQVSTAGPNTVDITTIPHTLLVKSALFNQVAFIHGEPHVGYGIQRLINTIYRYVGWKPDPPDEFMGYIGNNSEGEGAFLVVQVTIGLEEASDWLHLQRPQQII